MDMTRFIILEGQNAILKDENETALVELAELIDNAITEHENALVEIANMLAEMEG